MRRTIALPFVLTALACGLLLVAGQRGGSQPPAKKSELDDRFKRVAGDKDFIMISEQRPLHGKEEMELFARENYITDGRLTREQFQKYFEQRDELRRKTAGDPKRIALEVQAIEEKAAEHFK